MFLQSQNHIPIKDYKLKIDKYLGIQNIRLNLIKYKERRLVKQLQKDDFKKRKEFFKKVLQTLPFLYSKSESMEEFQWVKLAYNLHLRGLMVPELVRYQVGPTFYVSFGSVATQLKREFFLMLLDNEVSNAINLNDSRNIKVRKANFSRSNSNPTINCSNTKNFKYFTPEEMRNIILSGNRLECDFEETNVIRDESCLDWYNKWGWVYETEPNCYRAIDMRIGNYRLELEALDQLLQLGLSNATLPNMDLKYSTVEDLIKTKISMIKEVYMPQVRVQQDCLLEKLQKCKKHSETYFKLLNY